MILILVMLFFPNPLWAHGPAHPAGPTPSSTNPALIQRYQQEIEPIFRQKCFDCHSNQTRYPWYYRLPGAKQLINYDIREAREHIDMSKGFPFEGHHSLEEQLKDLREVIEKNEMPLWRYRLLHPGSGLTEAEKQTILQWIENTEVKISP